jgi:hypothetical protein
MRKKAFGRLHGEKNCDMFVLANILRCPHSNTSSPSRPFTWTVKAARLIVNEPRTDGHQ